MLIFSKLSYERANAITMLTRSRLKRESLSEYDPSKGIKRAGEPSVAEKASKFLKLISDQEMRDNNVNKNLLFRIFIEYAEEGYYNCSYEKSERLKNWISESKIDVNDKDWTKKYDSVVEDMDVTRRNKKPVLLAYVLKDFLPFLFKCNDDVNYVDENGQTILHLFLETCANNTYYYDKSLKVPHFAKRLIEMGASVNLADKQGITPLHIAAKKHDKELLDIMLKSFDNVHSCDEEGNTILHYVVEKSMNQWGMPTNDLNFLVCILLIKGADMRRKNKSGMTAVHVAAKYNHCEVLKIFLDCGADIDSRTDDGDTALLVICKNLSVHDDDGQKGCSIELLLERGCDVNATNENGCSALHFLANYHSDTVEMMMKHGADVSCRTKAFGLTPLHLTSCTKKIEILIRAGVDVDAKTVDGVTPLLLASIKKKLAVVAALIKYGADVEARDKLFGFTVLHLSAFRGDVNKFKFLLSRGLDVNHGGKFGITPLHLAALTGDREIVRMLIERGADVNYRDEITRSTPLHFASMKADKHTVDDLIDRLAAGKSGMSIKKSWEVSSLSPERHDEVIELLVKNGANVRLKDSEGKPALKK